MLARGSSPMSKLEQRIGESLVKKVEEKLVEKNEEVVNKTPKPRNTKMTSKKGSLLGLP